MHYAIGMSLLTIRGEILSVSGSSGCECVCVVVHFAGLRRTGQQENAVREGYVLVLVDGVVQCRRLGVEDVLPKRVGSE